MGYQDILKKKAKDWGYPELMSAARTCSIKKLPFSSPLMNYCTYGGIPRGRVTEFFGEPGGGKSTSAVDVCINAAKVFTDEYNEKVNDIRERISSGDKMAESELEDLQEVGPKRILYIDLEHGFDPDWANKLGMNACDLLDVMQPPNVVAEDILQTIEEVICSGEVGLVVLDSIPSLVTRKELEKKYGEVTVAALAGLLCVFMRKVVSLLTRYDCTLININQIRDNLNNPYDVNTPGGKAPKFYSSLRIRFRQDKPVDFLGNELPKNTENPAGYIISAAIVKQKTGSNDRKQGTYYLMCQSGIRPDFDYALLAVNKYHIIQKGGAWFTITDPYTKEVLIDESTGKPKPVKVNGMSKVFDYLNSNPDYYKKLQTYILNDINGISNDVYEEDTEILDYAESETTEEIISESTDISTNAVEDATTETTESVGHNDNDSD